MTFISQKLKVLVCKDTKILKIKIFACVSIVFLIFYNICAMFMKMYD